MPNFWYVLQGLNVYSILQHDTLVMSRDAVNRIVERMRTPINRWFNQFLICIFCHLPRSIYFVVVELRKRKSKNNDFFLNPNHKIAWLFNIFISCINLALFSLPWSSSFVVDCQRLIKYESSLMIETLYSGVRSIMDLPILRLLAIWGCWKISKIIT